LGSISEILNDFGTFCDLGSVETYNFSALYDLG